MERFELTPEQQSIVSAEMMQANIAAEKKMKGMVLGQFFETVGGGIGCECCFVEREIALEIMSITNPVELKEELEQCQN